MSSETIIQQMVGVADILYWSTIIVKRWWNWREKLRDMGKFEAKVWKAVGNKCGYINKNECMKYLIWDCGTTHISHCHADSGGTYRFKDTNLTMILMVMLGKAVHEESSMVIYLCPII